MSGVVTRNPIKQHMIVRFTDEGWDIILQRHHAYIATILLDALAWPLAKNNRIDLLVATSEHDNDYNEFCRTDLLNAAGAPRDFTMEPFRQTDCERLLWEGVAKSPLVGLLLSHHIQFVHAPQSTEAAAYCHRLKPLQRRLRNQAGIQVAESRKLYAVLQWCDALSLIICQQQIPVEGRRLEISRGPEAEPYWIQGLTSTTATVTPWPFEKSTVPISIVRRSIKKLQFNNDQEFQKELHQAPINVDMFTLRET